MTQKQCTEFKTELGALGAHPESSRAHCAQADCVAAVSWAVLQPVVGRVVGLAGRVAGMDLASRALRVMSRALGHVTRLLRRIVVTSRPCRSIVSQHSQLSSLLLSRYNRLYRDTPASQTARLSRYKDCIVTQPPAASPSLCHDTKLCITTQSTSQAARTRCQPCRGLP